MLTFPPDGTFLVQLVSFFALLAILKRLLFDPFQELLVEREQRTEGDAEMAAHERAQTKTLAEQVEKDLATAREQAMAEVDSLRRGTKQEEEDLFGRARDDAAKQLTQLRDQIVEARRSAAAELNEQAQQLGDAMVDAILSNRGGA